MKKHLAVLGMLAFGAMATTAHADPQALAESKQCLTCHAVDKTMPRAPSFQEIAKKYKGVANIELTLIQKVMNGGVGHWGPNAMPSAGARPAVSQAEASELVGWVLSQTK